MPLARSLSSCSLTLGPVRTEAAVRGVNREAVKCGLLESMRLPYYSTIHSVIQLLPLWLHLMRRGL